MNPTLLALYGLKWNPFSPELPIEAVYVSPRVENFCWRIEQALIREGGFAMIHGDPGSGKSVALRLTLNSTEATLTEPQIESAVQAILAQLGTQCGARLRA